MSNTRDSVSSAIQTPRVSSKILHCPSYSQISSPYLDIPTKHRLPLVFDILHEIFKFTAPFLMEITLHYSMVVHPFIILFK